MQSKKTFGFSNYSLSQLFVKMACSWLDRSRFYSNLEDKGLISAVIGDQGSVNYSILPPKPCSRVNNEAQTFHNDYMETRIGMNPAHS